MKRRKIRATCISRSPHKVTWRVQHPRKTTIYLVSLFPELSPSVHYYNAERLVNPTFQAEILPSLLAEIEFATSRQG